MGPPVTRRELGRRLDEIEALGKTGPERELLYAYYSLLTDFANYVRKQACRQPINVARVAKLIDERIGHASLRPFIEKARKS